MKSVEEDSFGAPERAYIQFVGSGGDLGAASEQRVDEIERFTADLVGASTSAPIGEGEGADLEVVADEGPFEIGSGPAKWFGFRGRTIALRETSEPSIDALVDEFVGFVGHVDG